MKLMSMIDYVDSKEETPTFDTPQIDWYDKEIDKLYQIRKYSNILKQPLTINMFVPCNEEGKVLKEPEWWYRYQNGASPFMNMDEIRPCQEYKKALENVLFEGFQLDYDTIVYNNYFRIWFTEGKAFLNNTYTQLENVEALVSHSIELNSNGIKTFSYEK